MSFPWSLPALSAVICFQQWVIYLCLIDRTTAVGPAPSLALVTVLNYTPMALAPLLLRRYFDRTDAAKWVQRLAAFGAALALISAGAIYQGAMVPLYGVLFLSSVLLGGAFAYLLALAARWSEREEKVKELQARISSGYYFGMLAATLGTSFAGVFDRQLFWTSAALLPLAICLVLRQSRVQFASATAVTEAPAAATPAHEYRLYLTINAFRYVAWGMISFLFPMVVLQRQNTGTSTFALVTAAAIFCMLGAAAWLGSPLARVLTGHTRRSAIVMNVLNGVCLYVAYTVASFEVFLVSELVASAVCVFAEVATTSGFIGRQPLERRATLTAWTSSLRAVGMACGNLLAWAGTGLPWALRPALLMLLLCVSGALCFRLFRKSGRPACAAAT